MIASYPSPPLSLVLGLGLLASVTASAGCSDDGPSTSTSPAETSTSTGDGDGDPSGDGDGDPTGDGDGDPTGDGDGDGEVPVEEPCTFLWEQTEMKVDGQVHAAYSVSVGPEGSFVAAGAIDGAPDDDLWFAKFDAEGNKLWDQVIDDAGGYDFASGVALDEAGDLYVIGSLGGGPNKDLWLSKRSGSDGSELWSVSEVSQFDGDNEPGDIVFGPDGKLYASATIRAGDDDTDIWLRKLEPADGAAIWTTSYSGEVDGAGFSIDRGASLAVTSEGGVFVAGIEGIDFETRDAIVLAYGPEGGAEQWRIAPQANPEPHLHTLSAIAAGPAGEVYFVVYKSSGEWAFTLYRASGAGEIEWTLSEQDFVYAATDNWSVNGLALANDGSHLTIAGNLRAEEIGQGINWSEVWVANISLAGQGQCIAAHTWQNDKIIPASTYGFGFGEGPQGTIAVGEIRNGPQNYLWWGGYQ